MGIAQMDLSPLFHSVPFVSLFVSLPFALFAAFCSNQEFLGDPRIQKSF